MAMLRRRAALTMMMRWRSNWIAPVSCSVRSVRPGFGLAPKHWDAVVGKRAARDIAVNTPVAWDALA